MSDIHEQAMNYVYQQVLQRLLSYFSRAERIALQLLIQRLIVAAGGIERIGEYKVLIAHGGGKDSTYTLAFLRAAQLSIAGRSPATFNLRVATLRHSGVTSVVMANIHRSYSALFMYDDPRIELLMVDNQQVLTFQHRTPLSLVSRELNRKSMLMSAHLTAGDGRTSFCNSCYLSLAKFFEQVTAWGTGVHALVSADSPGEQKRYMAWMLRSTQPAGEVHQPRPLNLDKVVKICGDLGEDYYQELYGDQHPAAHTTYQAESLTPVNPAFINIFDLLGGQADEHWLLLTEFLGFRFDDLAFHFSESDCANPLLMGHLRGLQAQHVRGLKYEVGIGEYLQLADVMMRRKQMSPRLIELALKAYDNPEKIRDRRGLAGAYAQEAFGLNEPQLLCLLYAPFVNHGRGLEAFLRYAHPGMLVAMADIHRALMAQPASEQVMQWLTDVSGLPLNLLQALYRMQQVDFEDEASLIAKVRASDPDKHRITIINLDSGLAMKEVLSGR